MSNSKKNLRWGIVGLGKIAHAFCKDLQLVEGNVIQAVASRSADKAQQFASQYGAPHAYGSYAELFADSSVDIVYIATPHDSHAQLSIDAANAKKHILCEKPLAVNQSQVKTMIEAAQKNKVFLMEAFWSRFNPSVKSCIELAKDGKTIGEVNYLNADFTFHRNDPDESRMLNMDLAGGSLLDMGVYPVFLAYSVFGVPEQILATARFHRTGADIQTSAILKYENGIAQIMSGFVSQSDMRAKIYGTKGQIFIEPIWHGAQAYTVVNIETGESKKVSLPTKGKGFTYEIEECCRCISNGQLESKHWSHQNSLELIQITDEIRRQVGLKYPFE